MSDEYYDNLTMVIYDFKAWISNSTNALFAHAFTMKIHDLFIYFIELSFKYIFIYMQQIRAAIFVFYLFACDTELLRCV